MPPRSSVRTDLPEDVRAALNERLVKQGFGGYAELSEWLKVEGYQISRSALHRYGQELATEYEAAMGDVRRATELARAYADADPDDAAALTGSIARMAQESLLRILLGLRQTENADPTDMARHMSSVSRALADLGRVTIQHSKHAADVRKAIAEEAARIAEAAAREAGVDGATADGIGQRIRIYLPDNQRRGAGASGG